MPGEGADVHLVDDGPGERRARRTVALPVVGAGIGDDALQRRGAVVSRPAGRRAAPGRRPRHALAVGIEQHLVAVEAQSARRIDGPVDAVAVELAGGDAGHEGVPVVIGALAARVEVDDARRRGVIDAIEKQQLDAGGVLREDAEVDAAGTERGAERKAGAVRCVAGPARRSSAPGPASVARLELPSADLSRPPPARCCAAARSASTTASSCRTRPAGMAGSPRRRRASIAALSSPVISQSTRRARLSTG